MKSFQRILDSAVLSVVALGASQRLSIERPESPDILTVDRDSSATATPVAKPKYHAQLRKLWSIMVVVLLVVSAAVIYGVRLFAGSYKPGVFVAVILWGIFLGIWALYFLKQKLITGTFGTVLGIGANELASGGAGLLAKANSSIKDIATQVGFIVGATQDSVFIGQCLWTFLIIFGLFCLPAFFLDEQDA